MRSSVRSETPRLERNLSHGSFHVSHEISTATSRVPTSVPVHSRRLTDSTMPSPDDGTSRPQTSPGPGPITPRTPRLKRWSSSRILERSPLSQTDSSLKSSQDLSRLESNRQSMKALADFLMKNEPPPTSWMSKSSDEDESPSSLSKSALNLFGKHKKRRSKTPKLLRLPDSAVAAKTRNGARHIAISIPLEHDHSEDLKEQHLHQIQQLSHSRSAPERPGQVVVLKPVKEDRESLYFAHPSTARQSRDELVDSMLAAPDSAVASPTELLGSDTAMRIMSYYLRSNQREPIVESASPKAEPPRGQKSYIAVSPNNMLRQDSQRSDSRHSGRTQYSTTSLATPPGHSRRPSTASSAPSATLISSLKLDLPPRTSSMSMISSSMQTGFLQVSELVNEQAQGESAISSLFLAKSGDDREITRSSSPSRAVIGTAETARKYSNSSPGGPQIVRSTTQKRLGGAPTRRLPDIPPNITIPRRSSSPPFQIKSSATTRSKETEARLKDAGKELPPRTIRQHRLERVKARKRRDIERLRSESGSPCSITDSMLSPISIDEPQNPTKLISTPPRNPKRRNASQEAHGRKMASSLTPIMVVANLAPYTGFVHISELPAPPSPKASRKTHNPSNSNLINGTTHTPPRSITSSPISDSDSLSDLNTRGSTRSKSPTRNLRGSLLETRRQERRAKRNVTLREKELNKRLQKIERDNEVLMSTLRGIAGSFGELSMALQKKRTIGRGMGHFGMLEGLPEAMHESSGESGMDSDGRRESDLRTMEPVMRELQGLAPRISTESFKSPNRDEFDEDDGASILSN